MKILNLVASITIFGLCVDNVFSFSRITQPQKKPIRNPSSGSSSSPPTTETFTFYGNIEPLGFFDPLKLTQNADEKTIKYLREAELHHGRIAMTSSIILPILDLTQKTELAINSLSDQNSMVNGACLSAMGMFELARMVSAYKKPRDKLFELKTDVQPGKLNPYYNVTQNIDLCNKELSNGRLAMLGVAGYIAQELITNQKIIGM